MNPDPRVCLVTPALLLLLAMSATIGCGSPGAPLPPSLNLPTPVVNLSAARIGNSVHLAWTMPTRTTDRVPLNHPIAVQVCRAIESGVCADIGSLSAGPGSPGSYTDELPVDLTRGPDRLLRYEIALPNHARKSAGPSNAAYSAAGSSPASLTGLSYQMVRDGVLLSWQPAVEADREVLFRIERRLVTNPAVAEAPKSFLAASTPAAEQTLVVHGTSDPGHALDNSAEFNQNYSYVLQRVATLKLSGRLVEVQGAPSDAMTVMTTDRFPPAVPEGLVAVADSAGGAIDLSWSPDGDGDLAAYRVYRRDAGGAVQRVASLGTETSYRDTGVQAAHTYAYSVSAVDQSGNESERCAEVEETLPAP